MSIDLVAALLLGAIALVLYVRTQPGLTASGAGKLLVFAALFVVPLVSLRAGLSTHMEGTKTTEFCLSCHVMEPYGQSLLLADERYVPAAHFQNRRVDRDTACFTCHTQYTIFGDVAAKLNGLQHAYVYFTGQTPDVIELYAPYHNRECLHCHVGARRFDELHAHDMSELVANTVSCMTCHGDAHDVHGLAGQPMWLDSIEPALEGGPIE